jgi:hypothetical protein
MEEFEGRKNTVVGIYVIVVFIAIPIILMLVLPDPYAHIGWFFPILYIIYINLMQNGVFYKKGTVDKYFSYLIGRLTTDHKFKVDKNTVDGSRYLIGTHKDYFISIYLYKKENSFHVFYKIIAFGYFGDEDLDKKIIMKNLVYKSDDYRSSYFISNNIIGKILDDIRYFQDRYFCF